MGEFNLTLVDFEHQNRISNIGINKFISEKLNEIILNNIFIEQTKIIEYDWQVIEDATIILKLVENQKIIFSKLKKIIDDVNCKDNASSNKPKEKLANIREKLYSEFLTFYYNMEYYYERNHSKNFNSQINISQNFKFI